MIILNYIMNSKMTQNNSFDAGGLEARLTQLEHHVHPATVEQVTLDPTLSLRSGLLENTVRAVEGTSDTSSEQRELQNEVAGPWALGLVEQLLDHGSEQRHLPLPPREELLPVVEHYFRKTNTFMPLFDSESFMRFFNAWFESPATRNGSKWAAIHIVMALGLRTPGLEAGELTTGTVRRANSHLSNAQSMLSELVVRDEDLLGIQVLLGIAIVLQNSSDQKAPSVIIASAMRLAHRLSLHSSKAARNFSQEETLQCSRVFWIAYTMDKARRRVHDGKRATKC